MSTYPEPTAPWPPMRRASAAHAAHADRVPGEPRVPPAAADARTPPEAPLRALARRVRDLAIMAVVGSAMGVIAIGAFDMAGRHEDAARLAAQAMRQAQAAAQREQERVLALLEDRPWHPDAPPTASIVPPPLPQPVLAQADFGSVHPTRDARHMADWVVARHDNGRMPFIVLDKRAARLYAFQPNGTLVQDTPVLLGQSHGDDTYPGIGNVPISEVKPYQRTTAAGRFVTRPGLDEDHTDVVWLDYDAALAMHRVINKVKSERRPWRLAQPNPKLRRISWGCINIPIPFFNEYISPVFGKQRGVVYVIPETKTFAEVFEKNGGAPAVGQTLAMDNAPAAPKAVVDR
ncbi:MAG: hypothetical protein ACTHL8_19270 [Burkholderiaceae bacterium]